MTERLDRRSATPVLLSCSMKSVLVMVMLAALALPASARANSGSITNVHPNGDGTVNATYSVTFDQCTYYGYCGFYAHAWELPASQACSPNATYLTYVSIATPSVSGTITETDFFYPHYNPTRICLYAYGAVGGGSGLQDHFIADYVYAAPVAAAPAPASTPAPAPTPAPSGAEEEPVKPMTISEARSYAPEVLRQKYKRRFARSTLKRACSRLSRRKVRCRVAWRKKPYRYSGTVTMWNDEDDPDSFIYRTSIRRKRIRSSHRRSRSSAGSPKPAKPSCNPNYVGACLPLTGDVDCGDISAHDFRSVGSDPFRLDGDGDGIACES